MYLQSLAYFGHLGSVETPPKSLLASHMSVGAQALADWIWWYCITACLSTSLLPACEGSCQHHRGVWYFESEKGSMIYSSISVEKPWLVFSSASAWVACENQICSQPNLCSFVSYYMQYLPNCLTSMFWLVEAAAGIMTCKEVEN